MACKSLLLPFAPFFVLSKRELWRAALSLGGTDSPHMGHPRTPRRRGYRMVSILSRKTTKHARVPTISRAARGGGLLRLRNSDIFGTTR